MKILFLNNLGAGFADQIDIAEGTTVAQLFEQRVSHGSPSDYLIRVNRQPTTSDYVLQPGDRVSVTPTKIEGAVAPISVSSSFSSVPKERPWEPANGSTVCTSPVS